MARRDRLTGLAAIAAHAREVFDSIPCWGRITGIGTTRRFGRTVQSVDVEIHYGNRPPFIQAFRVRPPPGTSLEVGQDIALRRTTSHTHDGGTSEYFSIDWDRPPNYGAGWPMATSEEEAVSSLQRSPDGLPPPLEHLRAAVKAFQQGRITPEELEQAKADARRYLQPPKKQQRPD